jgi:hypothetical protein
MSSEFPEMPQSLLEMVNDRARRQRIDPESLDTFKRAIAGTYYIGKLFELNVHMNRPVTPDNVMRLSPAALAMVSTLLPSDLTGKPLYMEIVHHALDRGFAFIDRDAVLLTDNGERLYQALISREAMHS